MFEINPGARRRTLLLAVSLAALSCAAPALGQTADGAGAPEKKVESKRPKVSDAKPTSPNATVNLLNLMVKRKLLSEDDAQSLIKQAEDEAYVSRQASKDASSKADEAAKAATAAAAAANPPGTKHVTYVPEVVKRQLREDIKREVMAKAEKENWASPGKYPEWAQRIRFYGDVRARYAGSFFPTGNDPSLYNFNAVNTGSAYDIAPGSTNAAFPTYNTYQNRNQVRLRARLGMDADLTNGFSAGLRIATGESNSPVSTNQTLGGGGSNFSKYSIWLDRAFLKYQLPNQDVVAQVGRFDNPFWSPNDLVWYRELGFDGVAVQAKQEVLPNITAFGVAGAFPIFNTDFNAGINNVLPETSKFASHDKWLYGAQGGFAMRFDPVSEFRFGVAYYDFENVQGQTSDPCYILDRADGCSSDLSRPLFAQKGNTYSAFRNIAQGTWNDFGRLNQFQYFGLVQKFRPVVASAQLDLGEFHPFHIIVDGEFVWNSAFDRALTVAGTGTKDAVAGMAINNRAGTADGSFGPFNGGDMGWMARVTVGNREIKHFADWNFHVGYKYLESDATLDAFADSDFGLGGTNLKGYFLGGNFGLSENVWASMRWLSANNIAGSPYAVDVLLVDLNAKF
ncbi:putative porin [Bradyrhizobium cenepequi]